MRQAPEGSLPVQTEQEDKHRGLETQNQEQKTERDTGHVPSDKTRQLFGSRPGMIIGDQIFYQDGKSGMVIGNQVFGSRPGMIIGNQVFYQDGGMGMVQGEP